QPWRFVVLTDPRMKTELAHAMEAEFARDLEKDGQSSDVIQKRINRSRERMANAPVVILLCVDMTDMDAYPDSPRKKAEYIIATQSAANAGMQMLLAAHAEGLGGVWVCSPIFAQATVQKALKLPKSWEPQAMFLLGYPLETPAARERKSVDEITKFVTAGKTGAS
ncbi:MAG: nitroreductase family protein, partial [Anaerolineales bacterium]|nr:nitroreductase family protein [Anaerolineales bacterium]